MNCLLPTPTHRYIKSNYLKLSTCCRVAVKDSRSSAISSLVSTARPCNFPIAASNPLINLSIALSANDSRAGCDSCVSDSEACVNGKLNCENPSRGDGGLNFTSGLWSCLQNCGELGSVPLSWLNRPPRDCWLHKMSSSTSLARALFAGGFLSVSLFSTGFFRRKNSLSIFTLPLLICERNVFNRCTRLPLCVHKCLWCENVCMCKCASTMVYLNLN